MGCHNYFATIPWLVIKNKGEKQKPVKLLPLLMHVADSCVHGTS